MSTILLSAKWYVVSFATKVYVLHKYYKDDFGPIKVFLLQQFSCLSPGVYWTKLNMVCQSALKHTGKKGAVKLIKQFVRIFCLVLCTTPIFLKTAAK